MNARERYLETLLFGRPDRVPLHPGGPRESTLAVWHKQGLPSDLTYQQALSEIIDVPLEAFAGVTGVPVDFRMIPTFEEKVLEHRDGHYVVRDWMGAITEISDEYDYTYIRSPKDFVTRKWHRFPVQTRCDWEDMRWRYESASQERYGHDDEYRAREASGLPLAVSLNGPFWQLREWVGMENLCLLMIDAPDFIAEMIACWQEFTLQTLANILGKVRVDALMVSEDMAYKAHSMISPKMVRRFLQPTYRRWNELIRSFDVPVYDMDSDGHIGELIPIWIESGFNCCNPIEVAAGNDIIAFRRQFGDRMAYHGGIDKRALAAGGVTMGREIKRVVPPMIETGGYIPGCDHGVPADISWPNFTEYTRQLADRCGWL